MDVYPSCGIEEISITVLLRLAVNHRGGHAVTDPGVRQDLDSVIGVTPQPG